MSRKKKTAGEPAAAPPAPKAHGPIIGVTKTLPPEPPPTLVIADEELVLDLILGR